MTDVPAPDPRPAPGPRCWTVVRQGTPVDVEVTVGDDESLAAVLPGLGRLLGVEETGGLFAGSTRLPDDLPLTAAELRHGAVLGWAHPAPGSRSAVRPSALEVHVVGGPDAGRILPLDQGRHVLGRGGAATICLQDPDVSRRHVLVDVGGGSITVTDLRSTNGTRLGDQRLDDRPHVWPTGVILRIGSSALTIAGPVAPAPSPGTSTGGRLRVHPAPRIMRPINHQVEVAFPRAPEPAPRRRLAWTAIALPALGGVLMAWLLHTPTYLFFTLLSPVVALGTWLSERWSVRRDARRQAGVHAEETRAAGRRLAEAVRLDVRATEAAHPDLATLVTAARRRSPVLWSRNRADPDALVVRIGSGRGETGVTRLEADGSRVRETAAHRPVTVDLRSGGLGVAGPRERVVGVLSAVVAQLTALHPPGDLDLVLVTEATRLPDWTWARWLPHLPPASVHVGGALGGSAVMPDDELHTRLTAVIGARRALRAGRDRHRAPSEPGWLVVVVDAALDPRTTAALAAAGEAGVVTIAAADAVEQLPAAVEATLRLAGETGDTGVLSRRGGPEHPSITVDRLPRTTAAEFARDLARLEPVGTTGTLPARVRLLDLPGPGIRLDAESSATTGAWDRARDRLTAVIGQSAEGPVEIDLCRQGPHALVAGTTGSGKSELLQTLIAGLALHHPSDRCSFLLVDYKGGAAFAEAAALPHTVGVVTDLDTHATARALRSLSAELTRREAMLASHGASDVAALAEEVSLGRLVIVVDEFATLAEELPSFVPGLVAIAQRGRSLGVHLVLATQRPAGAVSPEIRANCTLRICLRTTDEADSRDVLGTAHAAHLPVDVPGRAFLLSGRGDPTSVQVARVAGAARPDTRGRPEVRLWSWPWLPHAAPPPGPTAADSDLARIVRALGRRAAASGLPAPHRPWRTPLPDRLPATSLDEAGPTPSGHVMRLRIGLVDRPDSQSQDPLELDLGEGGTWLVVGGPRSGRTTVLRTVLSEAVHRLGPDELHVHVIEAGGTALAAEAARLPHVGTAIAGEDALRTVRLLDRLGQEVTARRAGRCPPSAPRLLLLVDGVEAVSAVLDEADPGRGAGALLRLARDGGAVGLTCLVTTDRAVPGGRLAAVAGQRVVLPLADRSDYAVAGVPPAAVPGHRPPGRALVGEEFLECQIASPRPYQPAARAAGPPDAATRPLRIADLAPDPVLPLPPPDGRPVPGNAEPGRLALPVGPGGDEGEVLVVDLTRSAGLLVAGPPGSGRSSALEAFAQHLAATGAAVLRIGRPAVGTVPGREPDDRFPVTWVDPADPAGVAAWLTRCTGGAPGIVVADDVAAASDIAALAALPAPGTPGAVPLLIGGSPGQLSASYQGPVAALRRNRTGLLLCPGPGDADLLGVRLPRAALPLRPGSGWLVVDGRPERVQVARRRADAPSTVPVPV